MDIESFRDFCLSFPAVTEGLPFGENILVFKVEGKMFALINLHNPTSFNVKCNPEKAIELREKYDYVEAGYHMNKKHWNTIHFAGTNSEFQYSPTQAQLKKWIRHSYQLIIDKLPKKKRIKLQTELEEMNLEKE